MLIALYHSGLATRFGQGRYDPTAFVSPQPTPHHPLHSSEPETGVAAKARSHEHDLLSRLQSASLNSLPYDSCLSLGLTRNADFSVSDNGRSATVRGRLEGGQRRHPNRPAHIGLHILCVSRLLAAATTTPPPELYFPLIHPLAY